MPVVVAAGVAAGLVGVVPGVPAVPAGAVGLSPDTTADLADAVPGDGICGDGTAGSCSLRAAVQEANAIAGADTIVLTAGATYTLGIPGAGEEDAATGDLDLNDSVTITGNDATLDAAFLDRYFDVRAGVATISGVTITAGHAPMTPEVLRPGYGGAVAVAPGATANITSVTATGNWAEEFAGAFGTRNGGVLNLTDITATANTSIFGGAVGSTFGTVSLTNTTIAANHADHGGGLFSIGTTTVLGSTVADNTTTGWGGGIATIIAGPLNVIDTAITGNSAALAGGILTLGAPTTIARSSITTNTATGPAGGVGIGLATADIDATTISTNTSPTGAGIYTTGDTDHPATVDITDATITNNTGTGLETGTNTTAELTNTIIADQTTGPDCTQTAGGLTSQGTNLDSDGTCALTHATDLTADPILADLTSTGARAGHTPLTGSPAIDTGANCNPTDQRGGDRPRHRICDRGAIEVPIESATGNPYNYLGTGLALASPWRENFALAISDACTPKEQGDRIVPVSDWNFSASVSGSGSFQGCVPGSPSHVRANAEHDPDGYFYVVEVPSTYPGLANLTIEGRSLAYCAAGGIGDAFRLSGSSESYDVPTTVTVRRDNGGDPGAGTVLWGPTTITSTTAPGGVTFCGDTDSTVMNGTNSSWRRLWTGPAGPGDRFLVQVDSNGTQTTDTGGINHFSLRARVSGSFVPCTGDPADSNVNAACPSVYPLDHLGAYLRAPNAGTTFTAARTEPEHGGKRLELELWDPGEGSAWLELLDPTGTPAQMTVEVACQDGTYTSETGVPCAGETAPASGYGPWATQRLDLAGGSQFCANRPSANVLSCSMFNDRLVRLAVDLPDDIAAAYGGRTYWRLSYRSSYMVVDKVTITALVRDPAG